MSPVKVGEKAPSFELMSTDGKKYSLNAALARGPLLAVFFKISCPTCQYTLPFFERMYQQFLAAGASNLQVWGISQDDLNNTRSFAKEWNVTFPLLIDDEPYELSQQFGLTHVPSYFQVSRFGQVEISGDGFSKSDLLAIRRSLAQQISVSPAELFKPGEEVPSFKPG